MFEIVDGRTDDGRTPEHGYTISSPCEPKGSGELKTSTCRFSFESSFSPLAAIGKHVYLSRVRNR